MWTSGWAWGSWVTARLLLGPLQMVVLMDPMEDPDDILRAHRSREKSYLFDVAFDFTATQVRGRLGLGTHGIPSLPSDWLEREPLGDPGTEPQETLHHSFSPCHIPTYTHMREPAWRIQSLLRGHTTVSTQMPPSTGTHTALPTGGPPRGAAGRCLKPRYLVLGGAPRGS